MSQSSLGAASVLRRESIRVFRGLRAHAIAAAVLAGAALFVVAPARADSMLTNATLFRVDSSGENINGTTVVDHGAWTTVLDQQNVPGNYGGELFLSKVATPGAADFLSPSLSMSTLLSPGANTFYFFANGDDTDGGAAGFGLNLFLDTAGATSPTFSGLTVPGSLLAPTGDTTAKTAGYNFQYATGAGLPTLSLDGNTITLTAFVVTAVGGTNGNSTIDLVNSTNTSAFTPPPTHDGIKDTYGSFTINVTPNAVATPLPSSATAGLVLLCGVSVMQLVRRRWTSVRA